MSITPDDDLIRLKHVVYITKYNFTMMLLYLII
jgi:hypothetical protein